MNKLNTILKLMGFLLCFSIKSLDAGGSFIDSILNEEERQTAQKLSSEEIDLGQFKRFTYADLIYENHERAFSRIKVLAATGDADWQLELAKRLFERNDKQTAYLVFEEIIRTMPPSFAYYKPLLALRERLNNDMTLLEYALRKLQLS